MVSRQEAIDALDKWEALHSWDEWCYVHKDDAEKFHIDAPTSVIEDLPSAQPDIRLKLIANLVEGSIDHFDRDDAMDLLYQIKEVLKDG